MVRLSNISKDASKEVVDDINATYAKMEKQEFDVFTGPIVDNEGKVQIPEGKRADDKMLTTMNYFVKGVPAKSRATSDLSLSLKAVASLGRLRKQKPASCGLLFVRRLAMLQWPQAPC